MLTETQKSEISRPLSLIAVALIGLLFWVFGVMWFTERVQSQATDTTTSSSDEAWDVYHYRGKKTLSFDYPKTWDVQTEKEIDDVPLITLSFQQNGKSYHMSINNPHTKEYRGAGYFSVDESRQYGSKSVLIKTLYFQNEPIEIVAVFTKFNPKTDSVQTVNLELPPKDTAFSLSVFDHVLTSLQYK
jgi:hypothetical protein